MTSDEPSDTRRVEEVMQRVAGDLSMITDHDLTIEAIEVDRSGERVPGSDGIQISFKLAFRKDGEIRHGCLLVPLPDAISLASYLMLIPDEEVEQRRTWEQLDDATKEALLELGSFIGGATDGALREALGEDVDVRTEGCQGVRAGRPPAVEHRADEEWIIGRALAHIDPYPQFEMLLEMPAFST